MCTEAICLETRYSHRDPGGQGDTEDIAVRFMDLDGSPFAALIIDKRSGEHLHFPYQQVLDLLAGGRR